MIVTISMVLLGVLLINTSQEAVRNSVLSNHKEIASRAANEIELFITRAEDILNTTAAMLGIIYPAPWKQETALVELVLNQPIFMRVSSVDLSGKELASSELGRGLTWEYPKDSLITIRERKTYISEVKILENHIPYVTIAVPIKKMGKIAGALIGDANLRGMWDIVDNIQLGDTGRAFLVAKDGTLIAHQDKKRVLKRENLSGEKDVQSVLAGKTEAVELEDELKRKWISSYASISGVEWGIVLRQAQDEAYLFSKVMKIQSWIIIMLSELVAILVSIFMAHLLTRPIRTLAARIKRVAGGDLGHKIEVRRRDEIGELIRSFNDMTEKLKRAKARERLSAIGEAAAWVTHELKNSLVVIKSFIQLFPQKHKDKKFVNKFNRLVPEEIYRWERMLKELSDFSSHSELKITEIRMNEFLANILEIMADNLSERKIDVHYDSRSDSLRLMADPERLKQVFMNLIMNAINAMPEGGSLRVSADFAYGENLRIYPECNQRNPTHIEVRIRDTGRGIPHDALDKIFEPFHTGDKKGMGLGLPITLKIIEQHGGSIEVESKIDIGTTFIVRLPIKIA